MTNSTIKPKKGPCLDCPKGSPEKYLIAERCGSHYKAHRTKISIAKKAAKETEAENEKESIIIEEVKKAKSIRKVSKKRQKESRQYTIKRLQFLAQPGNQRCPITGQMTTDIHHMKGRVGSLFLDTKYWLAVSREGHKRIEENPEWAKEMGYSLNRL